MNTDLKIELPAELVRSTVASIILDKLTPEQREGLLAASLAHLVEPTKNIHARYGDSTHLPSPLQDAFNRAAGAMLAKLANERLNSDPRFRAAIDGILDECLARLYSSESAADGHKSPRQALVDRVVSGMTKAFENAREW